MHRVLLGAAATVAALIAVSPASAQGAVAAAGLSSMSHHRALPGLGMVPGAGTRRHIHVGDGVEPFWGYGGYGFDNYDMNPSWRPDSFNDWWHDRPDRAYPRWMARNRGCARPWYSGDTLTC